MSAAPIRLGIGADGALARQALRLALADRGLAVILEAGTGRELELLCEAERPDVVLCADQLGGESTTSAIGAIASRGIDVLVVASEPAADSASACLLAGAVGYVTADLTVEALAEAVRAVHAGGAPLDPRAAAPLLRDWRDLRADGGSTGPRPAAGRALSTRELEILRLVASGQSTKAVAATLALSTKTVENHKTRIFEKLGVRSQSEAVAVGLSRGLLGDGG